ncbi:permease family-domain-containing protein [Kalaharituber pfeilii]|nr:permease family-domain-containing protein [Kalaharituber pfeilii]
MSEPDQIVPIVGRRLAFQDHLWRFVIQGLIGDYDYAFLFRKSRKISPFFALDDGMPVLLALLLGFQHALAMLAGVMSPPLILSGTGGANLPADVQQYLVSTSLIVCGFLSAIQITRFHIWRTPYCIGTGLISVVGTSFPIIPVAQGALAQMYGNGMDGTLLPYPNGYGALICTSCLCALLEIGLSFVPPRILKKVFPPLVTGPTVMFIGVKLIASGFKNWAGGNGPCANKPESGIFPLCPNINASHPLPWGATEFIGLGFSVFVSIILCERFGSPIMKSCSVVLGLLVGCIISAATGYFDRTDIDKAPAVSFIWVHTFKISLYGPLVLPLLAVYIILTCEAIGDITATCDVSRLEVEGKAFDSRIQGGVLADGLNGLLAGLCTNILMSTFAQNNGVIALTRRANRKQLVFSKFAAALVAIPSAVLGGMATFLFCSVAVSGMRITFTMPFTRRTNIFTRSYGAILVPNWFDYFFTYSGFLEAISLVMETWFAITPCTVAIILNLFLVEEIETAEDLPFFGRGRGIFDTDWFYFI